jgi:hypothetical protein
MAVFVSDEAHVVIGFRLCRSPDESILTKEPMQNHLKEIIYGLADRGVDFIIGGGVAAVLHGVERVTMDLDIAVDLSAANMAKFKAAIDELGLKPRVPIPIEKLADPAIVRQMIDEKHAVVFSLTDPNNPLRHLDLFIRPELTYLALKPHTVNVEADGRILRVLSASHLLALKEAIQPPRPKDVLDIAELRALLRTQDE